MIDAKYACSVKHYPCPVCDATPGDWCVGDEEPEVKRTHVARTYPVTDRQWAQFMSEENSKQ